MKSQETLAVPARVQEEAEEGGGEKGEGAKPEVKPETRNLEHENRNKKHENRNTKHESRIPNL